MTRKINMVNILIIVEYENTVMGDNFPSCTVEWCEFNKEFLIYKQAYTDVASPERRASKHPCMK